MRKITLIAMAMLVSGCQPAVKTYQQRWALEGSEKAEQVGRAAAGLGDVNGDGLDDFLVGAPGGAGRLGEIRLFYGTKNGLKNKPDWTWKGEAVGDQFGISMVSLRDADGDGLNDFAVGASNYEGRGAVYIFRGQSGAGPLLWSKLPGQTAGEGFGEVITFAGDLNGDKRADLAVAAYAHDQHRGAVYAFYQNEKGWSDIASWKSEGEQARDWYGYSMGAGKDFNGDGFDDLVVAAKNCTGKCLRWMEPTPVPAPDSSRVADPRGKIYLYPGSVNGLADKPSLVRMGEKDGDLFAYRCVPVDDVTGDGLDDLYLSAIGVNEHRGSVMLIAGSPSGLDRALAWQVEGREKGEHFGYSMADIGDITGDGKSELLVSSVEKSEVTVFEGAGREAAWTHVGGVFTDRFGSDSGNAGDLDGDGLNEFFVCAMAWSGSARIAGKVTVFSKGSQGMKTWGMN